MATDRNADSASPPRWRVDFLGEVHLDPERRDGVLAIPDPTTGFVRLDVRLTRTGVFRYQDASGREWGELRTDEEVFDPASMRSFEGVVVTNDHPAKFVDLESVKDVQVGHVGTDVRRDGNYLRASVFVTDADTIRDIRDGKVEVSCGYQTQVKLDRGVTDDGETYVGRHTDIRGNHLAIVTRGRAGSECRILDHDGAAVQTKGNTMPNKKDADTGDKQKRDAMLVVGETEFEVPDEVAAHVKALENRIAEMSEPEADAEGEEEDADKPEDMGDMPKPRPDHSAALVAKIDSLEAELAQRKADEARRIDQRVSLVANAQRILGAGARTDGLDDATLMRAVVLHVNPGLKAKLDANKSTAGYLAACYDHALERHALIEARADETDAALFGIEDNRNTNDSDDDLQALFVDFHARRMAGGEAG